MTLAPLTGSFWGSDFASGLASWLALLAPLALGVLAVVVIAGLVAGRMQRGTQKQRIWRGAIVTLLLITIAEASGAAGWTTATIRGFFHRRPAASRSSVGGIYSIGGIAGPVAASPVWPAAAWLGGVAIVLGRLTWVHARLRRERRRLRPVRSPGVRQKVGLLSERIGVAPPAVVSCRGLLCPVVIGCRRPMVVLPENFERVFDAECQAAILAHELGHVAARDAVWQLLVEMLTAILWWHPAIWWVRRQTARAAEAAADEATLLIHDGPGLLAQSLVELGWQLVGRRLHGSLAAQGLRSDLAQRVQHLLRLDRASPGPERPRRFGPVCWLMAVVCAAFVTFGVSYSAAAGDRGALLSRLWLSARLAFRESAPKEDLFVAAADQPSTPHSRAEAAAIARLHLTPDQEARFWALRSELEAATREMHRLPAGKIERGREINRVWIAGLKSIFTAEQFAEYCNYWDSQTPRRLLLSKVS